MSKNFRLTNISSVISSAEDYLDRNVSYKDTSDFYQERIDAVVDAHGGAEPREVIKKLEKQAMRKPAEEKKLKETRAAFAAAEAEAKPEVDAIRAQKAYNRANGVADWLDAKGFSSLFDNKAMPITYRQVIDRLAVAAQIAKDNVGFIAKVLGGIVEEREYGRMQPDSVRINKRSYAFGQLKELLLPVEGDSEIVAEARAKAFGLWEKWFNATVPGIKKGIIAYSERGFSEAELARICLFSTTKEIDQLISANRGEASRCRAAYINDGNFRMAALLEAKCSREAKAIEKALGKLSLDKKGITSHLIACSCARLVNSSMQGLADPVRWGFDENGLPIAVDDKQLQKYLKSAREAAEMVDEKSNKRAWPWNFQANFYLGLVDADVADYEDIADWIGLVDGVVKVGLCDNSGSKQEIEDRYFAVAARELKTCLEFSKKYPNVKTCTPYGKKFGPELEVFAGGKVRKTRNPLTAYYLERGERYNIFSNKDKLQSIETNLNWAQYCWISRDQAEDWELCYAEDTIKKYLKMAYRPDEFACLPDGELYYVQAPQFKKPGRDPRANIDQLLFTTYSPSGEMLGANLYGLVLQELRDEARAEIDAGGAASKSQDVPEDVAKTKAAVAALLLSKRK